MFYAVYGIPLSYEVAATRFERDTIAGGAALATPAKRHRLPDGLPPSFITPWDPPEYQEVRRQWEASRALEEGSSPPSPSSSCHSDTTPILRTAFDDFDPKLNGGVTPPLVTAFERKPLFSRTKSKSDLPESSSDCDGKRRRQKQSIYLQVVQMVSAILN